VKKTRRDFKKQKKKKNVSNSRRQNVAWRVRTDNKKNKRIIKIIIAYAGLRRTSDNARAVKVPFLETGLRSTLPKAPDNASGIRRRRRRRSP